MRDSFLNTPIEFLKGVGPNRAEVLKSELGIFSFEDLLQHYPFRYVDKTHFHKIQDIRDDSGHVQLRGKITRISEAGVGRGKRLTALFNDGTGTVELVWFKGIQWIQSSLHVHQEYVVYGKPGKFNSRYNVAHPELEKVQGGKVQPSSKLMPVYGTGEKLTARGLNSRGIEKIVANLLSELPGQVPEFIPEELLQRLQIPSREKALLGIHAPASQEVIHVCTKRLKFEELFLIQLGLLTNRNNNTRKLKGVVFDVVGDLFNRFYDDHLPFELTNAQKRVVKEVRRDVRNGTHMNRLIQGDVGSGKTVVALLVSLLAIDNGYQVCFMAPTEILANQHYATLRKMLGDLNVEVGLLTGSTKTADRKVLHTRLESGELNILVGTHALIEPKVVFRNLGLAVIDEQHRFGVKQRAKLWKKNSIPPHVLVMTATPIPRTLAMTMYGDLHVSVIDELPPGRKPVKTSHRYDASRARVFQFIEDEIKKGRQVYIVYPLIEESEALDYKDLMDGYESIARRFPLPEYRISIVHGKMKAEDKDFEMAQFVNGTTQILVSTTVIEVGVDVPNASLMMIESAERFGLSQLHQLRGRVGRGADQSFCILMTGHKLSADARTRLETMVRTSDGFEIAEVDLHLRGPGDIMGTQQSGVLDLKIANLLQDQKILAVARHLAEKIIDEDPDLQDEKHIGLKNEINRVLRQKMGWALIS